MTKAEFDQFYQLVQADRSTTERLKRAGTKEAFFAILQEFGRTRGYTLNADEMLKLAKDRGAEPGGSRQLSDRELESVAGGCGTCWGTGPGISDW